MPRIEFDVIDWDPRNIAYATRRGITVEEIEDVVRSTTDWRTNKRSCTGDVVTTGGHRGRAAHHRHRRLESGGTGHTTNQRLGGEVTDKPVERMTEEERSTYYYDNPEAIYDDFDWETPAESAPAKNLGVNTSVRFTIEEHRALRTAAARSGTTISEWIRAACAEAVERANDPVQQELQSTFRRIQEDVQYAHDLSTKVAKRDTRKSTGKSGRRSGTRSLPGAAEERT